MEIVIWQSLGKTLTEMSFAFPKFCFCFLTFKLQIMFACAHFFTCELTEANTSHCFINWPPQRDSEATKG